MNICYIVIDLLKVGVGYLCFHACVLTALRHFQVMLLEICDLHGDHG